jgi:hypothetical protein
MTKRRWMISAIFTSGRANPALPFQRAARSKPAAFQQRGADAKPKPASKQDTTPR